MSDPSTTRLSPADAARAFCLPALDETTFDTAPLRGRRYLLSFSLDGEASGPGDIAGGGVA